MSLSLPILFGCIFSNNQTVTGSGVRNRTMSKVDTINNTIRIKEKYFFIVELGWNWEWEMGSRKFRIEKTK
jgi:hypothetical protein